MREGSARTPSVRPNELSGMGRINASTQVGVAGRPTDLGATSARPGLGFGLFLLGGLVWFGVTSLVEVADPASDVSLALFLALVAATALVGGLIARSWRQIAALTLGSLIGLELSGLLVAREPGGHSQADLISVGALLVVLVLGGAGAVRIGRRVLLA